MADRLDEARPLLEEMLQASLDEGDESSLPDALAHLAFLECLAGNWSRAERYAKECREAHEMTSQGMSSQGEKIQALVDAHTGRVDEARMAAERGLSAAESTSYTWAVIQLNGIMGFLELSTGNLEAAEARLSTSVALADSIHLREPAVWQFHGDHIEAVIGLGELERAERLLAELNSRGRATGRRSTIAAAARYRGLLCASRGELNDATRALAGSVEIFRDLGMPFEQARSLLAAGQVQRRAKRKRAAKESLQQALDIFESLPAPLWAEKARAELSRLGLRPPAPLELTPTEERVAALAASGRTNREVAQALFVSPRTVEANLARVYRKLGVSSRAELGAAVARRSETTGADSR